MKPKRPKFITVRWLDHHESDGTWADPKTPEELKASRVESKGWLISENDECIEISSHRPMDSDDSSWGRPMRIVKAAIFYRSDIRNVHIKSVMSQRGSDACSLKVFEGTEN